jgi:membrane-bound ClpP family serine protease
VQSKLVSMKSAAHKIIISVVCLVLLFYHVAIKPVDFVAVAIVVIGIIPWLAALLEPAETGEFKFQFGHVKREQESQAEELALLKLLVSLVLSEYERTHLRKLDSQGPFHAEVRRNSTFEWELRHLISLKLIDGYPGKGIGTLFSQEGQRDIKDHLFITERGREYLGVL